MKKKYILKKNYDIEKLVKKKKSVGNKYYAIYFDETNNITPKIAISVSKKLGNAVVRNHEKRIIREIMRSYLCDLENLEMLIVVKKNSLDLPFIKRNEEISYLLKVIKKRRKK